jgi:hypothetical protein
MDTCVFCGRQGDDFAPEHWVPQWLSRKLFPTHGSGVRHNLPHGTWEADAFELTVKHVCNACNHHWLSDIEARASKYVFPLVMGAPDLSTITRVGMREVARWGYLKTISLELGRPGDQTPTHDGSVYADFQRRKWPPVPNCSIALGIREIGDDEPDPVFVWFRSQGGHPFAATPPATRRVTEGYRTTLLVGSLVFDVIGVKDPGRIGTSHEQGLVPLWPTPAHFGGTFTWPPKRRFRWRGDGLVLGP